MLALFIYWGWDTCLALTEETKDPKKTPGRAALLSTLLLLVTYVGITLAVMMYAGIGEEGTGLANPENADDVFYGLASQAMGPLGWFLIIAVAVSALSSSQTTILPTARGTFAMGIYKALPARFAKVSEKSQTPTFSTLLMGIISIAYFVGMSMVSNNLMQDSILSIGLAIALFYGIASFACIWYFRTSPVHLGTQLLLPFPLPAARRGVHGLGVRPVGHRHGGSGLRLRDHRRDRLHLRDRHRLAGPRARRNVRLVPVPRIQAVLPPGNHQQGLRDPGPRVTTRPSKWAPQALPRSGDAAGFQHRNTATRKATIVQILIIGAGGVGAAAARIAKRRDFFTSCLIADYDPTRPEKLIAELADPRFKAAQVDASDAAAVEALVRENGITHTLNAVDPRFVMPIFTGVTNAGATYLDMAM